MISQTLSVLGAIASIVGLFYDSIANPLLWFLLAACVLCTIILWRKNRSPSLPVEYQQSEQSIVVTQRSEHNNLTLRKLEVAFLSTKEIFFHDSRDKALNVLITKALQIQEYKFALDVALEIFYKDPKDKALIRIIDKSLKNGNIAIAKSASDEIFFHHNRDKVKRKIVDSLLD